MLPVFNSTVWTCKYHKGHMSDPIPSDRAQEQSKNIRNASGHMHARIRDKWDRQTDSPIFIWNAWLASATFASCDLHLS